MPMEFARVRGLAMTFEIAERGHGQDRCFDELASNQIGQTRLIEADDDANWSDPEQMSPLERRLQLALRARRSHLPTA